MNRQIQKFERHQLAAESLLSRYRHLWPFIFPFQNQSSYTKRRILESFKHRQHALYLDKYTWGVDSIRHLRLREWQPNPL